MAHLHNDLFNREWLQGNPGQPLDPAPAHIDPLIFQTENLFKKFKTFSLHATIATCSAGVSVLAGTSSVMTIAASWIGCAHLMNAYNNREDRMSSALSGVFFASIPMVTALTLENEFLLEGSGEAMGLLGASIATGFLEKQPFIPPIVPQLSALAITLVNNKGAEVATFVNTLGLTTILGAGMMTAFPGYALERLIGGKDANSLGVGLGLAGISAFICSISGSPLMGSTIAAIAGVAAGFFSVL